MKVTAAVTLYGMSDPAAEGCGVNPGLLVPEILSVPRVPFLWGLLYLVLVTQSCLTLCDPLDCSPPGSSIHGIFHARILEWVAIPPPGDLPDPGSEPMSLESSALAGGFFITRANWEAQ